MNGRVNSNEIAGVVGIWEVDHGLHEKGVVHGVYHHSAKTHSQLYTEKHNGDE